MKELKFKGTPGPWEIADIDDGWKDCVSARSANGNVIAVAETDNKEVAEADARLIAAAPELLEVSQEMASEFKRISGLLKGLKNSSLIDKAEAVIKKALEEK